MKRVSTESLLTLSALFAAFWGLPSLSGAACMDVAGKWTTTETVYASDCGEGTYTEHQTYTITQSGCNIIVSIGGRSFHGTVEGNTLTWSGSFPDEGGTTTLDPLSLTISGSGTSLSGSSVWYWSDGKYSCDGSTDVSATKVVNLKIKSVNQKSGISGDPVTIKGTDFGTTQGTVSFGSNAATVSSWGNTEIILTVPAGSGTVGITVTRSNGTSVSKSNAFTYKSTKIVAVSPRKAPAGATVTIKGSGFGMDQGGVTFGQSPATVISWSGTSVKVTAPAGSGAVDVTVTAANGASNTKTGAFTYK